MTTGPDARTYWDHKGLMLLWFAVLIGPAALAVDELVSYVLVKPVCFANARFVLTALNGVALALAATGALTARACLSKLRDASGDGAHPADRSYFIALVAIALNALTGLVIIFATIPHFVLSPCE